MSKIEMNYLWRNRLLLWCIAMMAVIIFAIIAIVNEHTHLQ